MRIRVNKIGENSHFYVDAEPTDTVRMLKEKVRAALDKAGNITETECVHLIYGGEWLTDGRILSEVGIDGKFYVGLEIMKRPASEPRSTNPSATSINVPRGPGITVPEVDGCTGGHEHEPTTDDDIFDVFRYVNLKYQRLSGKPVAPKAQHDQPVSSWSLTAAQLGELDTLFEMGFRRVIVVQVYVACNMNAVAAANVLLQE